MIFHPLESGTSVEGNEIDIEKKGKTIVFVLCYIVVIFLFLHLF